MGHALEYEHVLSDSPHSVPAGILSGGGLVLTGTYLSVLLVVGYFGVQAVRKADGSSKLFYGAVLATWAAYHVQASVSMDVPGLIYTQWVLGGVLVAGGVSASVTGLALPWKPRERHARRPNGALRLRRLAAASGLAVAFFFVLGPLSAPLRANRAVYRAQVTLAMADPGTAEIELARAIELQPRYGYYSESMAFVHELGGDLEAAFAQMDTGARLQPGVPYIALKAARAALTVGRLDAAEYWYERALDSDPYGGSVLEKGRRFYDEIGNAERADELRESIYSVFSAGVDTVCDGDTPALMTGADLPSAPGTVHVFLGFPASTAIDLFWSAPTDCGSEPVTGYKIEISTAYRPWTTLVRNSGSTETRYSSTGLSPSTSYWYRVSAINPIGTGPQVHSQWQMTGYEPELLAALAEAALSVDKFMTAEPHAVLRSHYTTRADAADEYGEEAFRNAKKEKLAMFRSHYSYLLLTGAVPDGSIYIDWHPATGVPKINVHE